jgi:nucleotide-binding universal stress UspA family protein
MVMDKVEEHTAGAGDGPPAPLMLVVGFDGSEPAMRALDAARRLLRGRTGSIQVVYVSHLTSVAELSASAEREMEEASDDLAERVRVEAQHHLAESDERWTFEHRRGDVVQQLIDVSEQLEGQRVGEGYTVIIVGSSTQRIHHFVGSVPVALVRQANVPVVVVP